jgi:hypothetical protein
VWVGAFSCRPPLLQYSWLFNDDINLCFPSFLFPSMVDVCGECVFRLLLSQCFASDPKSCMYIYMGIVSARMNINTPANTPHILIRGGDLYPDIYVCIDRYEYLCIYVCKWNSLAIYYFPLFWAFPFPRTVGQSRIFAVYEVQQMLHKHDEHRYSVGSLMDV